MSVLPFHPIVLVALLGLVGGFITIIFACRVSGKTPRTLLWLLVIVFMSPAIFIFLVLHPELVDSRFRTYKSFYNDIQIGMTREQVFLLLDQRYPKAGPRLRPQVMSDTDTDLGFFMNPEKWREPNCEGIFLKLESGKITNKEYSRD